MDRCFSLLLFVPVHEELVEDVVENVVVEGLFELFVEDVIVFVEYGQHLNRWRVTVCNRME